MTERGRGSVHRSRSALSIGPSTAWWNGEALTLDLDEIAVPLPQRVRGRITVIPTLLASETFVLDPAGRHRWRPIAPMARVEVAFDKPGIGWCGHGYVDSNDGDVPLEADFERWDWSRGTSRNGAVILYDTTARDGTGKTLALRFGKRGETVRFEPPGRQPLHRSGWGIQRTTRADPGNAPSIVRRLEDGPFYARSLVASRVLGEETLSVHETVSLVRFRRPWVQALLPFKMPRARGG